jgi:hypothetical protein
MPVKKDQPPPDLRYFTRHKLRNLCARKVSYLQSSVGRVSVGRGRLSPFCHRAVVITAGHLVEQGE